MQEERDRLGMNHDLGSAALPPISGKNPKTAKVKKHLENNPIDPHGVQKKRSQMNILSTSGYRIMNMDGRHKDITADGLNSEYQQSRQSFFEKGSVNESDEDLIDKFLSN